METQLSAKQLCRGSIPLCASSLPSCVKITHMDTVTAIAALVSFTSWGVGSLIAKMAADRIGTKSIFWDILGQIPAIVLFVLLRYRLRPLFMVDKTGAALAVLAGGIGAIGGIAFYFLLSRSQASTAVPLTALYPALTAILAFIILHESVTPAKVLGILFSLVAIYLLSK